MAYLREIAFQRFGQTAIRDSGRFNHRLNGELFQNSLFRIWRRCCQRGYFGRLYLWENNWLRRFDWHRITFSVDKILVSGRNPRVVFPTFALRLFELQGRS